MQLNSGSSSQFLMIEVYVTVGGGGGGEVFDMCCRCAEAKNLTVQASY